MLKCDYLLFGTRLHTTVHDRTNENTSKSAPPVVRRPDPLAGAPGRKAVANDESSAVTASSASRAVPSGLVSKRSVPGLDSRLLNCQPLEGQALAELFPERSIKSRDESEYTDCVQYAPLS